MNQLASSPRPAPGAEAFIAEARALLGERGFTTDPERIDSWLTDWRGRYTGRALALAAPASTAEVAALVKLCAAHGVPIVPQGGNSGMAGGATPDATGTAIILSLRRMNAIRSVAADSGQAVCEAGVILQTLHEAAEAAALRFPLTLGGKGSATIGGLVSTNAGGTQVLRHGTMRAQVLGLEAVLASGEVLDLLTPLKKDNRGFDLKQLLIGSEGTLGIVTAATLRLLPAATGRATAWVGLGGIVEARTLLRQTRTRCPRPAGRAPCMERADRMRFARTGFRCLARRPRNRARRRAGAGPHRRRRNRGERHPGRGLLGSARRDLGSRAGIGPGDAARYLGAGRGHARVHPRRRAGHRSRLPRHPRGRLRAPWRRQCPLPRPRPGRGRARRVGGGRGQGGQRAGA